MVEWYDIAISFLICLGMFGAGYILSLLRCDRKMKNITVGDLFITKTEHQPYLVAKIPMENIAERTYVTFEVKIVDDSQK